MSNIAQTVRGRSVYCFGRQNSDSIEVCCAMQTVRNSLAIESVMANPARDTEPVEGRELVKASNVFSAFKEALLRFNEDAVVYCQSIHESAACDYAADYRRMLQNCAKG